MVDFETTLGGTDPSAVNPDNNIVLACWTIVNPDGTYEHKHKFGNEFEQDELVKDCEASAFIVAHNAKFEAGWLKRCGLDLYNSLFFDTMLAEWVINGNRQLPLNLNAVATKYKAGSKQDLVSTLIKTGTCPSTIRQDWLLEYCQQDVLVTLRVFRFQKLILSQENLVHLVHTRNMTSTVLADIEFEGMSLDGEAVIREYFTTLTRRNLLGLRLEELTNGVLLSSPKQLQVYLYDVLAFEELRERGEPLRTESGQRATNKDIIKKLKITTEEQKSFLDLYFEFNRLDSLLQKNLEFFYKVVKERGATFHAKFQQGVTVTHRLSSAGIKLLFEGETKGKSVQFQNLPRDYKRLFWSGQEDYLIGECDGAQLEFRVAADVCKDAVATQEIIEGSDIHSVTAQVLTDAGEPTTRQNAKASTFAPLYGGMGKTPAQKAYAAFFKEKYHGISGAQYKWCMEVAANKRVILPWGMQFHWPHAQLDARSGRLNVSTEVHNYPVQSFATGDIIPIALIHFWHRAKGTSIKIQNTIHDSIVAKLHKDDVSTFEQISKEALTTDVFMYLNLVYKYQFTVPLGAGIKVSRNWGATPNERTYSVLPDGTFTIKDK